MPKQPSCLSGSYLLSVDNVWLYGTCINIRNKLDTKQQRLVYGGLQSRSRSHGAIIGALQIRGSFLKEREENIGEDNNQPLISRRNEARQEVSEGLNGNTATILLACTVGVLTGLSVVLFNIGVREIRDSLWDGLPSEGASWLRDEPLSSVWPRVVLVPTFGGFLVSILSAISSTIKNMDQTKEKVIEPVIRAISACFTLGSGNSLGPEGPSVEIGSSIAKGVTSLNVTPFDKASSTKTKLSLLAAGSAAGFSSGFNAAVAGCFFAVESVMWPAAGDSSSSLPNSTSMIIISAVIASLISEIGLGAEPAFKVPEYDFRSFGELPLYLLLGVFSGLIASAFLEATSFMRSLIDNVKKTSKVPSAAFPIVGGFATGVLALFYPEVLYWGFENVDILLESRPLTKGLPVEILMQLVGVKILATSFCRATGLVGGYYAPSLFIGAATGMAYGKIVNFFVYSLDPSFRSSILEVASPQAYGLVGMASMLAGVCQVPLTSVLLLFELTHDYRIVLPLLGAVGLSSWITSGRTKRVSDEKTPSSSVDTTLCHVENTLCLHDSAAIFESLAEDICVGDVMRSAYASVRIDSSLDEAFSRMVIQKQTCVMVVDQDDILRCLFSLDQIHYFCQNISLNKPFEQVLASEMCSNGSMFVTNPGESVVSLQKRMRMMNVTHVPVVSDNGILVGLIDEDCISVTCRILQTRDQLVDNMRTS